MTHQNSDISLPLCFWPLESYKEKNQDRLEILADKILSDKLTLLFPATGMTRFHKFVLPELLTDLDGRKLDVVYYNWGAKFPQRVAKHSQPPSSDPDPDPFKKLKKTVISTLKKNNKIKDEKYEYTDENHGLPLKIFFQQIYFPFASEPMVVILDQFEKLLRTRQDNEDFKKIIEQLSDAINDEQTPVLFLISTRKDSALELLNAFKGYLPTILFENFPGSVLNMDTSQYNPLNQRLETRPFFRFEKSKMRKRLKVIFGIMGIIIGWIVYNSVSDYLTPCLHFSTETEVSDTIEFYRGEFRNTKFLTFPGWNNYKAETIYKRTQAGKDESLTKKQVIKYANLNQEVIGQFPPIDRIPEYWKTGEIKKALDLADQFISGNDSIRKHHKIYKNTANYVIHILGALRSEISFNCLKKHAESSEYPFIRKEIIKIMGYMEPSVTIDFIISMIRDWKSYPSPLQPCIAQTLGEAGCITSNDKAAGALIDLLNILKLEDIKELSDKNTLILLIEALGKIGNTKAVEPLLSLLEEKDPDVRGAATKALGKIGNTKAVEPLLSLLKEKDSDVRDAATKALSKIGSIKAVEPLLLILREKDQSSDVRGAAAEVLVKIESSGAVKHLIPLLKKEYPDVQNAIEKVLDKIGNNEEFIRAAHDNLPPLLKNDSPDVLDAIAKVLGLTKCEEAIEALLLLLEKPPQLKDSSRSVQGSAAEALIQIGSDKAIPHLISLAERENNTTVKNTARYVLREIGGYSPTLIEDLKSEAVPERNSPAAEKLVKAANTDAVIPLICTLKDDDPYVVKAAAEVLGRIGDPRAFYRLRDMLEHQKINVRKAAAEALGQIGISRKDTLTPLLDMLKDQDEGMRRAAAQALGQMGNPEAIPLLLDMLRHQDSNRDGSSVSPPDLIKIAAEALSQIGLDRTESLDIVNSLLDILEKDKKDSNRRRSVIEALGEIGSSEAVEPLLSLLRDKEESVRKAAVEALGKTGSTKAIEPLLSLLKDQLEGYEQRYESVQIAATNVLGQAGRAEAVVPLISLLKDQDERIRKNAAQALGLIGSVEAVSPLISLLKDENSNVRASAAQALGAINRNEAISPLRSLLKDRDPSVRAASVQALHTLLGRIEAEAKAEVVLHLTSLLKDEEPNVRASAIIAIGKRSKNIDDIRKHYKDKKEAVRVRLASAAVLLSLNDDKEVTEFLEEKAESSKITERKILTEMLREVPSSRGNDLLIEISKDYDQNREIRIQAISALGFSKDKSILPYLHDFLENPDHKIREAAVKALANRASPKSIGSLEKIAKDAEERVPTRLSAITGLGKIGTEKAVNILLEILENENETYQFRAITALGDTRSARVIEPLKDRLEELEKRKAKWRKIRDEDTASYTDKQKADWRKRLDNVRPKRYLEFELAYAISRIDPEKEGVDEKLLGHDLAAVRQGAWMGLAKSGSVSLIKKLHDERRKKSKTPWFRHAAYRAIDHILIHIQAFGGKAELDQLNQLDDQFRSQITDEEKETDGVYTRVEWTIDRLEEREG